MNALIFVAIVGAMTFGLVLMMKYGVCVCEYALQSPRCRLGKSQLASRESCSVEKPVQAYTYALGSFHKISAEILFCTETLER